jgi:hypothetical protein
MPFGNLIVILTCRRQRIQLEQLNARNWDQTWGFMVNFPILIHSLESKRPCDQNRRNQSNELIIINK